MCECVSEISLVFRSRMATKYALLCDRVFVGDVFEVSSRSVRDSLLPSRPSNYKGWSQRSMAAALKAVIEDGMSVRGAAEYYGVPKSTLGDRVSGLGSLVDAAPTLVMKKKKNLLPFSAAPP